MALMIPFIAVAVILARETPQTCLESLTFLFLYYLTLDYLSLYHHHSLFNTYTDKLPIPQVR